jgi:hypothetical protein
MAADDGKIIPGLRGLVNGMEGKNYLFDDCMAFLIEHLGDEKHLYDYHLFAGLTGDTFTQVYDRGESTRCDYCISGFLAGEDFVNNIFGALGLGIEYIPAAALDANRDYYVKKFKEYIDSGVPVLAKVSINRTPGFETDVGSYIAYVGYSNGGDNLKFIYEDKGNIINFDSRHEIGQDWIFAERCMPRANPAELCREALLELQRTLKLPTNGTKYYSDKAFYAWADDVENGRYSNIIGHYDLWLNYKIYYSNLATNVACVGCFLDKAKLLNPEYAAVTDKIRNVFTRMKTLSEELDRACGAGFGATLENLDRNKYDVAYRLRRLGKLQSELRALVR